MGNAKDVLASMKSIRSTMKITGAMFLISSAKLRKAKGSLGAVTDYFHTMQHTIHEILQCMPELTHPFLHAPDGPPPRKRAYLVITADKGLAGAYNQAVVRLAEEQLAQDPNARLFLMGQMGRRYFTRRTPGQVVPDFTYSAQEPTLQRARRLGEELVTLFQEGEVEEISVIFTEMTSPLEAQPQILKLLPLDRGDFETSHLNKPMEPITEFYPSAAAVLDQVVPNYMVGILFGALTESYCAELQARMTAMDAATKNGAKMLQELQLLYHRSRQAAITQEIIEVSSGAKSFRQKKAKKGESL